MSAVIPDEFKDLLERPIFVTVATVLPDGQPHCSVTWCDYDGEHVLINTARGRRKEKNLLEQPMATILAIDPDNPYRYLEVRGTVELTEEGARDHIDKMARLYTGAEKYYGDFAPAEQENKEIRVLCKITPTKVVTFNPQG